MTKLTALIEAAKAATPGKWKQGMSSHHTVSEREGTGDYRIAEFHHAADASFVDHANPAAILELCALLEKAEEALKFYASPDTEADWDQDHGSTASEALAAIKQWKDQT